MSGLNRPKVINYTRERVRQRETLYELAQEHVAEGELLAGAIYDATYVICEHLEALVRATRDRGES